MNHYNGRLILKVKKRRNSIPLPNKRFIEEKENLCLTAPVKSLKRPNPFSKQEAGNEKSKKTVRNVLKENFQQSSLLSDLTSFENKDLQEKPVKSVSSYDIAEVQGQETKEAVAEAKEEDKSHLTYNSPQIPLEWTVKQKVKFISPSTFKIDLKTSNESKAIHQFSRGLNHPSNENDMVFNKYLYNWIHPVIPGVTNYPLKTTILGKTGKEEKQCINMLANNVELQTVVMKQWRTSFQSLFNMMKSSLCPYFFLCSHQFTVLFKASGISAETATAILGPTTKGLRDLLTQEGLNFEFVSQKEEESVDEIEYGFEDEVEETKEKDSENDELDDCQQQKVALNTSCDEDFFDSIGLSKKEHFPHMEQQKRMALRTKLDRLDKRPESVIKIKNCNGLFNFLLNAAFLCTPSGTLTGLPPTLLSPCSFEGASLNKNKMNTQPVKQMKKLTSNTINTVDISGYILPCQIYNICKLLTKTGNDVIIQNKTFESMKCLISVSSAKHNEAEGEEEDEESVVDPSSISKQNLLAATISDDLFQHLNQKPATLNDATEVKFHNGNFFF